MKTHFGGELTESTATENFNTSIYSKKSKDRQMASATNKYFQGISSWSAQKEDKTQEEDSAYISSSTRDGMNYTQ